MEDRLALDPLTLDVPLVDYVDLAAAAGFRSLGFFLQPAFADFPRPVLRHGTAEFEQVRARLAAHGLTVGNCAVFHLRADYRVDAETLAAFRTANLLGATGFNVGLLTPLPDDTLVRVYGEFARAAADHGLRANIEFMKFAPGASTLERALSLIERARAPNGGLTVDTLHVARTGTPVARLAALDPALVGHIQLCDGPLTIAPEDEAHEAGHHRLYPGEGRLPLAEMLAALPRHVPVGVETPRAHDRARGLPWPEITHRAYKTAHALLTEVAARPA